MRFNIGFFWARNVKVCNPLIKQDQLEEIACVFNKSESTRQEIIRAGEKFIISLYSGCRDITQILTTLMFQLFAESVIKSKFNLESLPLMQETAQHSFLRYYH